MDHKGTLSSAFNMSLGFIPVIISILLCEFITQDTAIYIGTGIGIVGIYLLLHRKGALIPNFILYIATGMLALLSLAALIPGDYVPPGALPLTLEVSILIPMLILYMHKKRFINHFLRQIGSCNKRLYAQGAEAAVVSARFALIFGILHFIIISIVVASQDPLSQTSMVILYKVFPPVVFVMSILFNQIAIRYFNHLMSHTEYVPIVNTKGDVIGRSLAIEALNYKNAYINPVIRIAVSTHGMLFLCDRPMNAILDKGKTDIPMECYLRYGESLTEGVNRLVHNALPHATEDFKPEFNIVYHFENETTNRLIYLFIVDIKDDSILCTPRFKNSKLWSFKQIEENMGKGFFSSCFEDEYADRRRQAAVGWSLLQEKQNRQPAYVYCFSHDLPGEELPPDPKTGKSDEMKGAFHSSELWYMFGTLGKSWRPMEAADYELSERMVSYWTNFARTGNPNGEGLPVWEPCTEKDAYVQILDVKK